MTAHSISRRTMRARCAAAALTVCGAVGVGGCPCHDVCPDPYAAMQFCTANGTCTVGGAPITDCAGDGTTPDCILWNPPPGMALTLPVGTMWSTLGARDDLAIVCTCASSGDAGGEGSGCDGTVVVLFDGMPATGCSCLPGRAITCENVPHSVKVISLTFPQGTSDLALEFHDDECEAAHRVCER